MDEICVLIRSYSGGDIICGVALSRADAEAWVRDRTERLEAVKKARENISSLYGGFVNANLGRSDAQAAYRKGLIDVLPLQVQADLKCMRGESFTYEVHQIFAALSIDGGPAQGMC